MITIELNKAHAAPVASGHPWVFAQAVARVHGDPEPGDEVLVVDPYGKRLGRGFWSPKSAIVVRLLTRDAEQGLDDAWLAQRIREAVQMRSVLGLPSAATTGHRLINAEGDGLAGLIVDRFGDALVCQLLTVGMQRRKQQVVAQLVEALSPTSILEVESPAAQAREGIESSGGGMLFGELPEMLSFRERELDIAISPGAQKTGYYFDQREHRAEVERLAKGRDVLDACCYVGGFALGAARGGANSVLALDSSQPALDQGARIAADNGLSGIVWKRADVRRELERMVERHHSYDLVILDPPKLVPTARHLEKGRRAYRQLNRQALRMLRPGGVLVTCSCSAGMGETDFLRMLSLASRDAERELSVFRVGRQGPDHPVPPGFSEGMYLKTVFAVVR